MQIMPRIALDHPPTYDDLVALPEHLVAEIVDDELHASPRPAFPHARAATALTTLLASAFDFGHAGPGGWILLTEPELHFKRDVLVPDIAGWRRTRLPAVPDVPHLALAPDWLCEVLSPSTTALDRGHKLPVYAREGVKHVWLLDPLARVLEVHRLDAGAWRLAGAYENGDVVQVEPFEAVPIDLRLVWGTAPSLTR
jgi:Uma2 family endonuclease